MGTTDPTKVGRAEDSEIVHVYAVELTKDGEPDSRKTYVAKAKRYIEIGKTAIARREDLHMDYSSLRISIRGGTIPIRFDVPPKLPHSVYIKGQDVFGTEKSKQAFNVINSMDLAPHHVVHVKRRDLREEEITKLLGPNRRRVVT